MRGTGREKAATCVTQGPAGSAVGGEEEVSQWAQQFMPQNSDFPFQPTEPRHLSQQDPRVGEGTGARGYLRDRAGLSLTSPVFPDLGPYGACGQLNSAGHTVAEDALPHVSDRHGCWEYKCNQQGSTTIS